MAYFLFALLLGITTSSMHPSEELIQQIAAQISAWDFDFKPANPRAPSLRFLEQDIKAIVSKPARSLELMRDALFAGNTNIINLLLLYGADASHLTKEELTLLQRYTTLLKDGGYIRMLAQADRGYRGVEQIVSFEKPLHITDTDLWTLIYKSPEEAESILSQFNFRQLIALSRRSPRYYNIVREFIRSRKAPGKPNIIIISVYSHHDIAKYVNTNSTLVYDVDETLTYRRTPFFNRKAASLKTAMRQEIDKISPDLYPRIASKMHEDAELFLMEKSIPALISNFIKQGIPVLACTKRYHGTFGVIDRFEEHTYQALQKLGVNFNFGKKTLKIELDTKNCKAGRSSSVLLYNDILFTDDNSKGPALIETFFALGIIPEHVVIVDDLDENLYEAAAYLSLWGIEITCIHYGRVKSSGPFNKEELETSIKSTLDVELVNHKANIYKHKTT